MSQTRQTIHETGKTQVPIRYNIKTQYIILQTPTCLKSLFLCFLCYTLCPIYIFLYVKKIKKFFIKINKVRDLLILRAGATPSSKENKENKISKFPKQIAQTCRTVCSILSRYAWNYIALHEGCHRSVGGITSRCAWAAIELFVC